MLSGNWIIVLYKFVSNFTSHADVATSSPINKTLASTFNLLSNPFFIEFKIIIDPRVVLMSVLGFKALSQTI